MYGCLCPVSLITCLWLRVNLHTGASPHLKGFEHQKKLRAGIMR